MFLVVELWPPIWAIRLYGSIGAIRNTENLGIFLRETWELAGNKTGNHRNSFISHQPSVPPFEPLPSTLPIPHPALRPQTAGGTNLVGLSPLRLRLVDTSLQDLGNGSTLLTLQPRPNHFFPRITFVTRFLLIAGEFAPGLECRATIRILIRTVLWLPPTTGRGSAARPSTSI